MQNQHEISEKGTQRPIRYELQTRTTAKMEGYLNNTTLPGLPGNTAAMLSMGCRHTMFGIAKIWAQQQAYAAKNGLPITNEVALSTLSLAGEGILIRRRRSTAKYHLELLAYAGILLHQEGTKNTQTGDALPLTKPGEGSKQVYFLNPELCGYDCGSPHISSAVNSSH